MYMPPHVVNKRIVLKDVQRERPSVWGTVVWERHGQSDDGSLYATFHYQYHFHRDTDEQVDSYHNLWVAKKPCDVTLHLEFDKAFAAAFEGLKVPTAGADLVVTSQSAIKVLNKVVTLKVDPPREGVSSLPSLRAYDESGAEIRVCYWNDKPVERLDKGKFAQKIFSMF